MKEKMKNLKKKTKEFCQEHKKGIVVGIASTVTGVIAIVAKAMSKSTDKENYKYSDKFFRDASDEELDIERERVRIKRNSCYDDSYDVYYNLLNKFDNVIVNRMNEKYEKEHPDVKPVYHEHGWYLPEDDD